MAWLRLLDRNVTIEISNKTRDVTLRNPRSYCYSGKSITPPSPCIPPGVTESCEFTNSIIRFQGCMVLVVYEAAAFTLAILFSNPLNKGFYWMELAMEISFRKAHLGDLEKICHRMYSGDPAKTGKATSFHRVKIGACQEPVVISDGNMMITGTMSSARRSIVKVVVENLDSPTP